MTAGHFGKCGGGGASGAAPGRSPAGGADDEYGNSPSNPSRRSMFASALLLQLRFEGEPTQIGGANGA